ncbi:MAG: hypothetical protein RL262_1838 [Bacteroidota bacterium]
MILNLHKVFFILGCVLLGAILSLDTYAQQPTTLAVKDTSELAQDSLLKKDTLMIKHILALPGTYQKADAWFMQEQLELKKDSLVDYVKSYKTYYSNKKNAFKLYNQNSLTNKGTQIIYKIEQRYAVSDKDWLFYLIVGIILIYGFVNNMYPQYFQKLFSQFSQSSMRMMQNREQLLNNSVASLLLNLCFILSFSLMASLLIYNRHLLPISFWLVYLYICLFFASLYLGKYICLEIAGAIFSTKELVKTYVFVVFMINKVLGILLLPFILILAFAKPIYFPAAILFLYRYLFSLTSVRNKLHISSFHFFLYLCAFEILPIMILYKLVVQYFGGTY